MFNCVNSLLLSTVGKSKGQTTSASQQQPLGFRFMKEPGYVIFLISNVLMMAGLFLPPVFLPETIQIKGLALNVVNYVFLISGLSQILGRLMSGFCASRKPLYVTFICSMFMIFAGLSLLIVPLCTEMSHFLAFGLINGFFLGKLPFLSSLFRCIPLVFYHITNTWKVCVNNAFRLVSNRGKRIRYLYLTITLLFIFCVFV